MSISLLCTSHTEKVLISAGIKFALCDYDAAHSILLKFCEGEQKSDVYNPWSKWSSTKINNNNGGAAASSKSVASAAAPGPSVDPAEEEDNNAASAEGGDGDGEGKEGIEPEGDGGSDGNITATPSVDPADAAGGAGEGGGVAVAGADGGALRPGSAKVKMGGNNKKKMQLQLKQPVRTYMDDINDQVLSVMVS